MRRRIGRYTLAIILCIGFWAALPATGSAQSEQIDSLVEQGSALRSDKRPSDALAVFDEAIAIAREANGENTALFRRLQRNRVLSLYDLGRIEEAIEILEHHIGVSATTPDDQRSEFSADFEILSAIREKGGQLPEALALISRAIESQTESTPAQDRVRRLISRVRLAMSVEDYELARRSLRRILVINESENVLPEAVITQVYTKLVQAYRGEEAYTEAKGAVREHLAFLLDTNEDEQSLRIGELHTELGLLSLMEQTYEEAVIHFERALANWHAAFNVPNYYFVRHLDNLSFAATMAFNNKLAADAALEALEIAEQTGEETGEELTKRRQNTAHLLLLAGKLEQAKPLFEHALAKQEEGREKLDLLWNLAAIHYLRNDDPSYDKLKTTIVDHLAATNYPIVEVGREGYWGVPTGRAHLALVKLDIALQLIDEETGIDDTEQMDWLISSANALMIHGFVERAGERIDDLADFVEDRFGRDDWNYARVLELQSQLAFQRHRYQDAKKYIEAAIALRRRLIPDTAFGDPVLEFGNELAYRQIAMIYAGEEQTAQAIQYATLALTSAERSYGRDSGFTTPYILHLADLQVSAGNIEAGTSLLGELTADSRADTPLSKQQALMVSTIAAQIAIKKGDSTQALALVDETLADAESVYWFDRAVIAEILLQKASILTNDRQYEHSLETLERAVGLIDKDRNPVLFANALFERGKVRTFSHSGETEENLTSAYQDFARVAAIEEDMIGEDGALSIRAQHAMASVAFQQRRLELAMHHAETATQLAQKRIELAKGFGGFSQKLSIETYRDVFMQHIRILGLRNTANSVSKEEFSQATYGKSEESFVPTVLPIDTADFASAFISAQWVGEVSVSNAIRNVSDRLAGEDGDLSGLIREHQDKRLEIETLKEDLLKMVVQPPVSQDPDSESKLLLRIKKLETDLKGLNEEISSKYPTYSERVLPGVVPLDEARALLAEKEALILYRFDEVGGIAMLVTPETEVLLALAIGATELENQVEGIRDSLTFGARGPRRYANTAAHLLYRSIFKPFMPHLEDVRKVILSVDGPLLRFPFEAMVVGQQNRPLRTNDDYAETDWLGDHFAFTVTPSIQVLRSLRNSPDPVGGNTVPFIGVGDPVLGVAAPERGRRGKVRMLAGGLADPSEIRSLPPLPETSDELKQMAGYYGTGRSVLYLGENASEAALRGGPMQSAKVLAFATHGTVAQDIGNIDEPALVLTPPEEASAEDDGLLTASEIALEKLQADLVLLSACNTSASDGRFLSSGLSGLAKSFFYAGSKSLLVSHWPIESEATVLLTTGVLQRLTDNPTLSVAEAVRASAKRLRTDPTLRKYAHPVYWAPFSVIGG